MDSVTQFNITVNKAALIEAVIMSTTSIIIVHQFWSFLADLRKRNKNSLKYRHYQNKSRDVSLKQLVEVCKVMSPASKCTLLLAEVTQLYVNYLSISNMTENLSKPGVSYSLSHFATGLLCH